MANQYKLLVIHCTATREGQDLDGAWVKRVHMDQFGWDRPGYSHLFHLNGFREVLREHDQDGTIEWNEITYGAGHVNAVARHVCYVGGMNADNTAAKDTRTREQQLALMHFVHNEVNGNPQLKVIGHNQIHARSCPSFDVPKWCKEIGIPQENIFEGPFDWGKL